jgi:hypothetical protein
MHVLAALALLVPLASTAPTGVVVDSPNRVEVCSTASGTCRSLPAASLDPTFAAGAGQTAFVDPETGALTTPTAEQLEELAALSGPVAVREESRFGAAVETVRHLDGSVTARPAGGFVVELVATVPSEGAEDAVTAPAATACPEPHP